MNQRILPQAANVLAAFLLLGALFPAFQAATAQTSGGECMVARFNATKPANNTKLNCTSNDVRLAQYQLISGPTACFAGETIEVVLKGEFLATAAQRWDVGVFVRQDGSSPNTLAGTCYQDFLHPVSQTNTDLNLTGGFGPFYNGERTQDPGDMCGDIQQGQNAFLQTQMIEIVCQDSNDNGTADVGSCTVWANSRSAGTASKPSCIDESDVTAETTAKCTCGNVEISGLDVLREAEIEVVKDLAPDDDEGLFDLQIDGNTEAVDASDGGTTGKVTVSAGTNQNPGDTHTVGEVEGTNSTVGLAGYDTAISCVDRGMGTFDGGPPLTADGAGPLDVPVDPDDDIVCTITNVRRVLNFGDPGIELAMSFDRTYQWEVTKEVDPATHDLFAGDMASSDYTVTATNTGSEDGNYALNGTAIIQNDSGTDATVERVTADVAGNALSTDDDTVVCNDGLNDLAPGDYPYLLVDLASLTCTFSQSLPDGSGGIVEVAVETSGDVQGASSQQAFDFNEANPAVTVSEINDEVTVTDTFMGTTDELGTATVAESPKTFDETTNPDVLSREFTCSSDPADYTDGVLMFTKDNTAEVIGDGDEVLDDAVAEVEVNCYAPVVTKDAETSFTRTWTWEITKSADQTDLVLALNQGEFPVNYGVEVDASSTDGNFAVAGTITVVNPHPSEAMMVTLADVLDDGTAASFTDCDPDNTVVPAAGEADCSYTASPTDASATKNTATATLNGIEFGGEADVAFDLNAPTEEVDECIDVSDTHPEFGDAFGTPAQVCADDPLPKLFEYTRQIRFTDPADCGPQTVDNTASFETTDDDNDTDASGQSSWTVNVDVQCDPACTLTQGYWKTHNESFKADRNGKGPSSDPTWGDIGPTAEAEPFFQSGMSYFEVLWTPPKGNVYYNLAHQYIAAELNNLNDGFIAAADPSVQEAFDDATQIFENCTPDDLAALKGKKTTGCAGPTLKRNDITGLAGTLGAFNEGELGVPHCDEFIPDENGLASRMALAEEAVEAVADVLEDAATEDAAAEELTPEAKVAGAEADEAHTADIKAAGEEVAPEAEAAALEAQAEAAEIPNAFRITNYPNPFNPTTTLRIELPEAVRVTLVIYDVLGRQVTRLVDNDLAAGVHEFSWDGGNLPSGMYFYSARAGTFTQTRHMVLTK